MCGIVGFVDFKNKLTKKTLNNMVKTLSHRGPDDEGQSYYKCKSNNVGLGHKRLSILDLSFQGHQPMSYENYEIVYNGEVYNYKEIRNELIEYSYSFNSDSDTEVIVKAFHKWGVRAVDKFIGMFAIAIFDKLNQRMTLIRDRTGVKPLFYFINDDVFIFSSELKSFHKNESFIKDIDRESLGIYMQYGYIPEPCSIFSSTYKLRAGHYLEFDIKDKTVNEKCYWDVFNFYNKPKLNLDIVEIISRTDELLKSAFNYRMVSDVPVGIFLSGGIDSSVVSAMLQSDSSTKINTFTIGFHENSYNEANYAKDIAKYLGTNHTEYYCTVKDALEIIPKLPYIYDEPFGDSSAIPTTLVSRLARQDVKVCLSADGGDEIFAGYNKYDMSFRLYRLLSATPEPVKYLIKHCLTMINPKYIPFLNNTYNFDGRYDKIKSCLTANDCVEVMDYLSQGFTSKQIANILGINFFSKNTNFKDYELNNAHDIINRMLAVDYKTYLIDDILTKVDRASMSVSLESREPFLDHRIVEFVSQIPSAIKYKKNSKKWLLKQIAYKYLPKEMIDRPKKGFSIPINHWFKKELKEYFLIYLDKERLKREGYLNPTLILQLRDRYLSGKKMNIQKLWYILMFEMWLEQWGEY